MAKLNSFTFLTLNGYFKGPGEDGFWPTAAAVQHFPKVAEGMNKAQKIVFSRKLRKAAWNNTSVISGDIVKQVRELKKKSRKPLTILGSGSIVRQLSEAGLIDTYQIMLDPVALGKGSTLFGGVKHDLTLKLENTRVFKNGSVLLTYTTAKK